MGHEIKTGKAFARKKLHQSLDGRRVVDGSAPRGSFHFGMLSAWTRFAPGII